MGSSKETPQPIVLRPGASVGSVDADMDGEFLFSCFVDNSAYTRSCDITSPQMIISGRTGSGKTAILLYIQHCQENVVHIDPIEMSLSYVSNSDALRFVQEMGGNLDLLFQCLWKHVLCIEFIRLRYRVDNEEKSKNVFKRLWEYFQYDDRRKKSLEYLREWERKFWIPMDHNIKELTERFEKKLQAELRAEI